VFNCVFICFRLVEPSEEAHSKDTQSFVQGLLMKTTDIIAKAKVVLIGMNRSFSMVNMS
jgi:hypothetical protein